MLIEVMSFPSDRDNQHPVLRERLVKCIQNARENTSSMELLEAILKKALAICKDVKVDAKERAAKVAEKEARLAEEVELLVIEAEDEAAEYEEECLEEDAILGAIQDANEGLDEGLEDLVDADD